MSLRSRIKSAYFSFTNDTIWTPELLKLGSSFFYSIGAGSTAWAANDCLKDFLEIPEMNAIGNLKSRMFSNGKLQLISDATGKEQSQQQDLVKTLRNPNYFQSQKEFLKQSNLFHTIWGNEVMYMNYPLGFSKLSTKALFTLPYNLIDIKVTEAAPYYLFSQRPAGVEYSFRWGSKSYSLPIDSIIHLNDNRVDYSPDNFLKGQSFISSVKVALNNLRSVYEARNVLIENRGALGILSNDQRDAIGNVLPFNSEDQKKLQDDYQSKYGLKFSKWQLILTSMALKYQQITVDPDKLKLYEEGREDMMKLCDSFGIPYELFGNDKGITYENQKWAERRAYQNTIIPDAQEWVTALNSSLETADKSWHIIMTYDHLPIFEENRKERAQSIAMTINGLSIALRDQALTLDEYKKELQKLGILQ